MLKKLMPQQLTRLKKNLVLMILFSLPTQLKSFNLKMAQNWWKETFRLS